MGLTEATALTSALAALTMALASLLTAGATLLWTWRQQRQIDGNTADIGRCLERHNLPPAPPTT